MDYELNVKSCFWCKRDFLPETSSSIFCYPCLDAVRFLKAAGKKEILFCLFHGNMKVVFDA